MRKRCDGRIQEPQEYLHSCSWPRRPSPTEREGQRRRERERACQDRCIAFIGAKLLKKTKKQAILSCCRVVARQHKGIIISNMGTKQTCVPSLIAQHLIVWEEKAAKETNQQGFRVFGLLDFLSRAVFQTPFFYPFINTTTNL